MGLASQELHSGPFIEKPKGLVAVLQKMGPD
jgi:hypothetical protein